MNEASLRRLFETVLAASLSVPLVIACGGKLGDGREAELDASDSDANAPDGGSIDAHVANDGQVVADHFTPPPDGGFQDHASGSCHVPPGACEYVLPLSCSDAGLPPDGGPLNCPALCLDPGAGNFGCTPSTGPNGEPSVTCYSCGVGRRPSGLVATKRKRGGHGVSELGAYFAEIAHLEAASVHAFHMLERELVDHGAPQRLTRAAARAARDEIRHARVTSRLARRFGGVPQTPRVVQRTRRSLVSIACENAVEGCVRETFGALEATWQAKNAADGEVRSKMARIAVDETRHAALAWAVHQWAWTKLDARGQRRVLRARRDAVQTLAREVATPKPEALVREAGAFDASAALSLVRAMDRSLWAC